MRRTKADSEQTRLHILTAARREFARHGVTRTTLQRIAAAAGVTRGAVYWHFTNKLALFRAMREQVSLPLFDRTDLLDADAADPLAAVERFLHDIVARVAADLQTRRTLDILALKCEYVDEFRPELKRHTLRCAELTDKFAVAYRQARKLGTLRADVAAETAALSTSVFVTGLIRLWLMDSDASLVRPRADALIAGHVAQLRA